MTSTLRPMQGEKTGKSERTNLWLIGGGLLLGLVVGAVVLIAAGVWRPGTSRYQGIVLQSPQPVQNFTLHNAEGAAVSLRDFRGQVVLLYFGYTFCPDVCPASMAEMKEAMALMGRRADEVQVIMVSVDPERDTPAQLQEYVNYFHPTFIGLTGTESEILAATTPLGVFFEKSEGTAVTGYLIDHTATILAIDKKGYLRLVFPFGTTGEEIAADLRILIRD